MKIFLWMCDWWPVLEVHADTWGFDVGPLFVNWLRLRILNAQFHATKYGVTLRLYAKDGGYQWLHWHPRRPLMRGFVE